MLIVVAAFLIYHCTVHTIRKSRPLGGANVNITRGDAGRAKRRSCSIPRIRNFSSALCGPAGATRRSTRNAHRAWYTCSASHDGRAWAPPERAAAVPTDVADLFADLQKSTGLSTTVVADRGIAHAFWINIGEVDFAQDIYGLR